MSRKIIIFLTITLISIVNAAAQPIRFSPDGTILAANWLVQYGDYERIDQVLLFDFASGRIRSSINLDENMLEKPQIRFARGNQSLLVGDVNGIAVINLKADNEHEVEDFETSYGNYDKKLVGVVLSANGKTVYKAYADELAAYDYLSKKAISEDARKIEPGEKGSRNEFIAIHSGGRFLVEYEKKKLQHALIVHNLAANTRKRILLPYDYEDDAKAKFSAEISDNGEILVLQCQIDDEKSQLSIWDLKTGASLGVFSVSSLDEEILPNFYPIERFAVSPDGNKLAVKINHKYDDEMKNLLFLWDVATKKETLTEAKKYSQEWFANELVFTPDAKQLVVSSHVLLPGSLTLKLQMLDAGTGKFLREFGN